MAKAKIYESPDGGKTVYEREAGSNPADRVLVTSDSELTITLSNDWIDDDMELDLDVDAITISTDGIAINDMLNESGYNSDWNDYKYRSESISKRRKLDNIFAPNPYDKQGMYKSWYVSEVSRAGEALNKFEYQDRPNKDEVGVYAIEQLAKGKKPRT